MGKLCESDIRAIAKAYRPSGWIIHERRAKHQADGLAYWPTKTIHCLPLKDKYALFVLLHEVGHIANGHMGEQPSATEPPAWQMEWEAEQFAIKAFKENGLRVDTWTMGAARANVAYQFEMFPDTLDPDDPICLKALKFAYPKKWRTLL